MPSPRRLRRVATILGTLLVLHAAGGAAAPAASSPAAPIAPARGSENPWLVAGPFPIPALGSLEDGLDLDYLAASGLSRGGEASAAPLRISAVGAKAWREAEAGANPAGVDFIALLGPTSNSVAYAYRDIVSRDRQRLSLRIGSDDGVKVWLNGDLVLAHHIRRALSPGEDEAAVSLERGKNRILVKVSQAEGAWGFAMRLLPLEEDEVPASELMGAILLPCPDSLSLPEGGTIGGLLMAKPSRWARAEALVELLGPRGERLASDTAQIGGRFSLKIPPSFSGPARLRATGRGLLAGLASQASSIIVGDAASLAKAGAARAHRLAASLPAESPGDAEPSLEFLAALLEGALSPALGGFEAAVQALGQVDAPGAGAGDWGGLSRRAYRSALDGSLQPYSLYLPQGYRAARRYGLVIALHGASGNDLEMAASLAVAAPEDLLIAAPYGRGDLYYSSTGERDVLDLVDSLLARYSIDPDRVYLAGKSMGGFGAWRLGQLYPRRFAALASFAGWTDLDCLENLGSMPVLAVHGDSDGTVAPVAESRAVDRLKSLGGSIRFDLLPGVGHEAFDAWIGRTGPSRLLDWFRQYRREAWPQVTRIRTKLPRGGRGDWASILGQVQPLSIAALDAKILDSRHLSVDTQNVSAFELDLRHPALAKGGRILILADGRNLTADAGSAHAAFELKADGGFTRVTTARDASAANTGSGLAALFDGPLILVYGSAKKARAAENRSVAEALAVWDGLSIGTRARFPVIADSELTPAMEASHSLLLVGWPEDNSVLARLAPRLPLAIKGGRVSLPVAAAGAAAARPGPGKAAASPTGSGLLLVCPNPEAPGRLVGVAALPLRGRAALDFADTVVAPLRSYGPQTGPSGYGTPDVTILDATGQALWSGDFDWRWERLEKLEGEP